MALYRPITVIPCFPVEIADTSLPVCNYCLSEDTPSEVGVLTAVSRIIWMWLLVQSTLSPRRYGGIDVSKLMRMTLAVLEGRYPPVRCLPQGHTRPGCWYCHLAQGLPVV